MEKVSIQEASRRLNVSQDVIRRYIREGKLRAAREGATQGRAWLVELPENGWLDDDKQAYIQLEQQMPTWWWPEPEKTGLVHYLESTGIEELMPVFLCGLTSENIWGANGHTEEQRCPDCAAAAKSRGLLL
ncbi:MAG TPA: helix-turn-helix domain-containing protein [Dehalococcoidia bacterium]|nr:helix-turn-helix domain-containing protein [Dehalococcoidia bacterium]